MFPRVSCLIASTIVPCVQTIDPSTRAAISRVSNIITSLARSNVPLTDVLLNEAYDWAVEQDVKTTQLLNEDVAETMVIALSAYTL